jgi:universal stress protein E
MTLGDLIKTLLLCIRKDRANILVLGALSRNVVESAIVGSTAEKILYDTPCDVLIMKLNR